LHFELSYYQPLSWCIDQGYHRFEGGAQGVHKMARGLLPSPTRSWHWIADPQFRDAIGRFVARESQGMAMHREELERHSPMKTPPEQ
jgi:predicted N-acyltransferase